MATQEELYVAISPVSFRVGRTNLLEGQATLLKTIKHLNNLKILARRKNDLKKKLQKSFLSVQTSIDDIQSNMPKPKIPKFLKKEELSVAEKPAVKADISKRQLIDDELMKIQEKF